jgi:hypothetical protein
MDQRPGYLAILPDFDPVITCMVEEYLVQIVALDDVTVVGEARCKRYPVLDYRPAGAGESEAVELIEMAV